MWAFAIVVAVLFASGIVWRALNPSASDNPTDNPSEEQDIAARQDGYYLCLHRAPMTPGEMYKLIKRELPKDDPVAALRGCQQAQER